MRSPSARLRSSGSGMTDRLQGNAVAGDFVAGLAVDLGAIENALQVGYAHDGSVVGFGKQAFGLNVCCAEARSPAAGLLPGAFSCVSRWAGFSGNTLAPVSRSCA